MTGQVGWRARCARLYTTGAGQHTQRAGPQTLPHPAIPPVVRHAPSGCAAHLSTTVVMRGAEVTAGL